MFPHQGKPSAPLRQLLLRVSELASRAGKLSLLLVLLLACPGSRWPCCQQKEGRQAQERGARAESGAAMVAAGGGFQATVAPWDTRATNTGDTAFSAPGRGPRHAHTRQEPPQGSAGMAADEECPLLPADRVTLPCLGVSIAKLAVGASCDEEGLRDVWDFTCLLHPLEEQSEKKRCARLYPSPQTFCRWSCASLSLIKYKAPSLQVMNHFCARIPALCPWVSLKK